MMTLGMFIVLLAFLVRFQSFPLRAYHTYQPTTPVKYETILSRTYALPVSQIGKSFRNSGPGKMKHYAGPISQPYSNKKSLLDQATNGFPFWVLAASILGNFFPQFFRWFGIFITPALAMTMMAMGMTLTVADFKRIAKNPQFVLIGLFAQYLIMPFSASFICKLFKLNDSLSSGLILVGCAPGGTASNLVTMIAQADLPLSVVMTATSTVAAVVMTPFLTTLLAGAYVKVKAVDLMLSSLNVVLAPVMAGLWINSAFPKFSSEIAQYTPFASVVLVSMICGTISATNSGVKLGVPSANLVAAIALLHLTGFLLGYALASLLGAGEKRSRTISIETGMQNSALACVLAQHFPNPQLCALPGSISATCHSILGSLLAAYWRRRTPPTIQVEVQDDDSTEAASSLDRESNDNSVTVGTS